MAQEIELKLNLSAAGAEALASHPLVARFQRAPAEVVWLSNRYYDTRDLALNRHAVALRIRRQGARYIQTLKTRGQAVGGLHQRGEWEWELERDELDIQCLPAGALPEGVAVTDLEPLFSTDFERRHWLLEVQDFGGQADIEMALDRGWVVSGERREPLRELELELKSGSPEVLLALARRFATEVPLQVNDLSKAERGYRLAVPERARELPPLVRPEGLVAETAFAELGASLNARLLAALDAWQRLGRLELLEATEDTLDALQAAVDAMPREAFEDELSILLAASRRELEQARAPSRLCRLLGDEEGLAEATRVERPAVGAWLESLGLGECLVVLTQVLYRHSGAA